jgi:hypothetical protein
MFFHPALFVCRLQRRDHALAGQSELEEATQSLIERMARIKDAMVATTSGFSRVAWTAVVVGVIDK